MSSTGARKKRTPFDIAIESLRDTNNIDIQNMKKFSAESSPIAGQAGGTSTNSATPGGSFLNIAGQTPMIGAIAFHPVNVTINSDGHIDITPTETPPDDYSTYVQMIGTGTPDDLNFIDGAANSGQLLKLQGNIAQLLNVKHANIGGISNIVGTGTVTVTTTLAHGLITGEKVNIINTTNFNIVNATITVTGGSTFTYSATGSATPETVGIFQNGNIVTADGSDIALDGTAFANVVPYIELIFDPTLATGVWRVQFGAGATGGGLTEPVILGINTLTPQTSPTVTPIAWNTKNPQHITIDRNITFSFTDLPASGSYEGVLVIIDINATGGFNTPIWPASVANPPTVSTIANTRTSVMLYTIDGGTVVTHATGVGSSTGGNFANQQLSNLSNPALNTDLSFGTFDGTNIDRLRFVIDSAAPASSADPSIFLDTSGDMIQNVAALDSIIWKANNVPMAKIVESTAGVYRFDMLDHTIDNAKDVRFDASASFAGSGAQPTIGFDTTSGEFRYNTPATKTHKFVVNNAFAVEIADASMTFVDGFQIVCNPSTTTPGISIGLVTGDPSTTANAELWYNATTNKLRTKENGVNVNVIGGTGSGDVVGPASATDNAIARFDTTTGKLIQNSSVTINDAGDIISGSGNVDVGDSATGWDAFFGRRIEFPNLLGTLIAANRQIVSRAVEGTNAILINVPTDQDFVISENGITNPPAFLMDMSAGILQVDNPILTIKINNSSPLNITKADSVAAAFFSGNGFDFDGGDIEINDNDLNGVNNIFMTTSLGAAVGSIRGIDTSTDVLEIRLGAASDFAVTDNGTIRLAFNNTLLRWEFGGSSLVQLPQETQISDRSSAPSTPPSGFVSLYVINAAGAQTFKIKFDNGTEKTIADDT